MRADGGLQGLWPGAQRLGLKAAGSATPKHDSMFLEPYRVKDFSCAVFGKVGMSAVFSFVTVFPVVPLAVALVSSCPRS